MGADNWGVCPRCYGKALESLGKRKEVGEARIADAYGKVPVDVFDAMRSQLAAATCPVEREDFRTFREDYGIGVDDEGEFVVTYSGHCSACNLDHVFKTSQMVKLQ